MLSNLKVAAATILTLVSFVFAADVTLSIDGTSLNYNSSSDIYGFQFNHDGCASGAAGGDAVANGFTVSASPTTVLAFSFSGSFIPAGSGTLVDLGGECSTLSSIVVSGQGGTSLEVELSGGDPGADHVVEAGSFYFSPADLAINPGESVEWYNAAGFHDVNGVASSITGDSFGNPEEFSLGAVSGPASIGMFTFSTPGVYQYDCSIGSHAANGMVGTVTVGDGGCTDDSACNHDADADFDDDSCEYPAENEDCDGSCTVEVDCAGVCGGSAVEDACGVCNGDGSTCEDHHIDLAFGAVTDNSIEILMTNTMGVSGFQFNVTGADLSAASGGRAADAGFQVSTGADGIVLGFSFLGDVIPAGSGVLTNLSYTASAAEGCIENEIIALDDFSGFYSINIGDCAILPFACEDLDGDDICDDVDDCVGEYDECDVCNGDGSSCATTSVDVLYNSAADIYGFQFQVDGVTLVSAGGGDAEAAGFTVSTGNNTVLGFAFDGSSIAAGSGVLTTLEVQGDASAACLSNLVLSGASGADLGDEITDCLTVTYTIPCADVDEDGICDEEDDCVGEYDNCDVCNGDGTSCQQHIDLEFGAVTDGTIEILLTNTMPIAGFQFNVTGADLDGAFGGRAADAGFEVSTGADGIVLGFSFLGSSIPEGEGVLTNLNYTATAAEGCLENEIFALGDFSGFYEVNIGDCAALPFACEDLDGDDICDDVDDCVGEYDECDVCNGDGSSCATTSVDVLYNSAADIYGFQFQVDGVTLVSAGGGDAEAAGFTVSTGNNTVLGFAFDGSSIAAGSGVLTTLEVQGDASAACLSNLVLSGASGADLGDEITDCLTVTYTIPCADVDEDGICDEEDDCVGEYDNCDVCNGDGTSCQQHIDLEFGAVTDGTIEILLTNTMPIAGFQFNVTGADLDGAFGGRAADAGFEVSTGAYGIVLGFSFLGSSIPEGEGVLTNLNYTATAAEGCLENEIFALGDFSGFYEVNIGDCAAFETPPVSGSSEVLYNSDANIAGFQFHVGGDLALTNVSGGAAADAGFTISFNSSTNNVIAFSLTGASIPAGSGVLVNLEYDGSGSPCLEDLILSDENANPLDASVEDCLTVSYSESCADNDSDGLCDDEDSDDDNDGVDDSEDCAPFDASASTEDCAGVCGGDAVVDECGECGGDGASFECEDGSLVCDAAECPEPPGADVSFQLADNGDGTLNVNYESNADVYGFQFLVTGITVTGASGGDAAGVGFTVSVGNNTVLGFAFDGSYIPAGAGVLTVLDFEGSGEACLANPVVSGQGGSPLNTDVGDCINIEQTCDDFDGDGICDADDADDDNDGVDDSEDCAPLDASASAEDCAGVCGGDAVEDECGVCNGDGIPAGDCDCDGNVLDCAGVCGGDAVVDECGECGGDGIGDGECDCDGNVPDCAGVCGGTAENCPEWDDCPSCFEFTASMTAIVNHSLTGEQLGDEGDILAAFDDAGELRGVALQLNVPFGPYEGTILYEIQLRSDNAGDVLGFKYYDSSADEVLDSGTSYTFIVDDIIGDVITPHEIQVGAVTIDIPISPGWNWFSLNVEGDLSIGSVMGSLNSTEGDFIKSASASATYYTSFGWYGGLEELNVTGMYKFQSANADLLTYSGAPVNPASTPISLAEGWNWIGFLPQHDGPTAQALASITTSQNDFIKNQSASSTYYDDFGWYGGLEVMAPTEGYMLSVATGSELIYPGFGPDDALTRIQVRKELPVAIAGWEVNYHEFEFNGTITLSIDNQEDMIGDHIAVFVGDELRGVAERNYFPFGDSYIYTAMVYSNVSAGEELSFKYYSSEKNAIITYRETLEFTSDMIVGDGFNTFGLSRQADALSPVEVSISEAYPNPFNPVTSFAYTIPVEGMVELNVYDVGGRVVAQLVNGWQNAGTYPIEWDAQELSSGVYIVKLLTAENTTSQKLMLIK